jgi:hypothetical protein
MLEISQQLRYQRAVLILRKPFEYLLSNTASVQQRLFLPLEKALQAEPREPVKQGMGRFLQSDPARLPLSTPFWMLIGSFIHGATLGAVFGFLVHYVFRPLYDRMQVSTRGSLWSPLRPQALLELGEHSNWHDIRLAYVEAISRALEGEEFAFELRLEVYQNSSENKRIFRSASVSA